MQKRFFSLERDFSFSRKKNLSCARKIFLEKEKSSRQKGKNYFCRLLLCRTKCCLRLKMKLFFKNTIFSVTSSAATVNTFHLTPISDNDLIFLFAMHSINVFDRIFIAKVRKNRIAVRKNIIVALKHNQCF